MPGVSVRAGLAAFAAVVGLVGCTHTDDDVASLGDAVTVTSPAAGTNSAKGTSAPGGTDSQSSAAASGPADRADGTAEADADAAADGPASSMEAPQRERAEAMVACLTDRSLPARLDYQADGQAALGFDPPKGLYAWVAHGMEDDSGDKEAGDMAEEAEGEGRMLLWMGGADHTEDYVACLDTSHYTPPGVYPDATTERRVKQLQTDLNNDFAACARANGFGEVQDLPPPAVDGLPGVMEVELPLRITEAELRTLLGVCPPVDEGRIRALADGAAGGTAEGVVMGPTIWFEIPGLEGTESWTMGMDGRVRAFDSESTFIDVTAEASEDLVQAAALAEVMIDVKQQVLAELIDQLAVEGIRYDGPQVTRG